MTQKEFDRLNPGFDRVLNEMGNYDLRLSPDKMQQFHVVKYDILNESVQQLVNTPTNYETRTVYKYKGKRKG